MLHTAFATLLLAFAIIMQSCDPSALLDLIVTYNVAVQNAGTQPAYVHVTVSDVSRGAYIAPGHSVSVTSFAGGKYSILVAPWYPSTNASLTKLNADLEAKLANPDALSPAEVTALTAQLRLVQNEVLIRQAGAGTASCKGELKADAQNKDRAPALSATASNRGLQWAISGC